MVSNNCASVILTLKSFTWYTFNRKIWRILKVAHYLLTYLLTYLLYGAESL